MFVRNVKLESIMKATIEFSLPDEKEEFEMYSKAGDYYSALIEIDNYCRNKLKHNELLTEETEKHLQAIRDFVVEAKIW